MEKNNSKMNSSDILSAIKEDEVFMSVMKMLYNTTVKIVKIINNYEGIITDYDEETACITISTDNFTDELFYISCFKSDVIDCCNYHKPKYELINIWMVDDIIIFKVKV